MNHPKSPAAVQTIVSAREASIGRMLLEMGKILPEDAERILRMQKENGIRFGEAAQTLGLVSEADIQQVLARQFDYPYLQPGEGNFAPELVAAYQPFSSQVETLRAVRSQLMLRWFATGRRSLAVAAVHPGQGASLLAANLAVVFSQLGEQTLLVDANLRKPRQQKVFNLTGNQGLSDILADRADFGSVSRIGAFVDLSVLQAGTIAPNPQELLSRGAFGELHQNLAASFDVVLYDVPAFSVGADALAVAARAEGVLLVARRNVTTLADIHLAAVQINQMGAQLVGSVLVDY